jgi:microcystin-dependent protein
MDFYLGQIGTFAFNFAPVSWAQCAGSILPISQNTALFSLVGATYGGNGTSTFALPDLRSRTAMGIGPQTAMGELGGTEQVTLSTAQIPAHNHLMRVNNGVAADGKAAGNVFATAKGSGTISSYAPPSGSVTLNPQTISLDGGGVPHPNLQPFLAVNFCIATQGIYPPRS